MLPTNLNLKSAFSLYPLHSSQQQQQQQQQLLFLQAQQLFQKSQSNQPSAVQLNQQANQLQLPQQSNISLNQATVLPTTQNSSVFTGSCGNIQNSTLMPLTAYKLQNMIQPSLSQANDVQQFNQNLFYQAVFAGKELETFLDNVLKRKQKLEGLTDFFQSFPFPTFIKLIGNITLTSLQCKIDFLQDAHPFKMSSSLVGVLFQQYLISFKIDLYFYLSKGTFEKGDVKIIGELVENPMKIQLKENVWKSLIAVISRKLFSFADAALEEYTKELTSLFFFKPEIADSLFSILSDPQGSITLGQLFSLYQMLQTSGSTIDVFNSLSFQLFGGRQFKIKQETFRNTFEPNVKLLSDYFERPNIIVGFVRRTNKLNIQEDLLLQNYLKTMGDFKQTNLKNFFSEICSTIFVSSEGIEKEAFDKKVAQIHEKTNSQIIFSLFQILRIELDLVHRQEFVKSFQNVSQANSVNEKENSNNSAAQSSNYYLKTIDKLLNKCVFNGDEKCGCKKCQCIRRNRNSAKESQKKKREALQQIGPLLEKLDTQEQRIQELESENMILRKLITEMVSKGANQSNVQEIFQPISKIISYQLKEEENGESNDPNSFESKPHKKICPNNKNDDSNNKEDINSQIEELSKSQSQQQLLE